MERKLLIVLILLASDISIGFPLYHPLHPVQMAIRAGASRRNRQQEEVKENQLILNYNGEFYKPFNLYMEIRFK